MVYLNFCITFSNTCDHLKQVTRLIVDMYQFMDVDLNSIKTYIFEYVSSKDNHSFFEEKKMTSKMFYTLRKSCLFDEFNSEGKQFNFGKKRLDQFSL